MLEKDKEYIVNIESLGYEGEGVARIDGIPVFIPGALINEQVKIKIDKVKKNFAFGKLIEVLQESEERRKSECNNFKKCGGKVLKKADPIVKILNLHDTFHYHEDYIYIIPRYSKNFKFVNKKIEDKLKRLNSIYDEDIKH